ncbi:MAG: hypothetical protein FJX75_19600 [Armatimonadetes bacterium]|nr:hypothetical protein [Armatimonadota bacterium]
MAKLSPLPPREVERILGRNGLERGTDRPHGTEWVDPADPARRTTVPRKGRIRRGTLAAIAHQAKKTLDELKGR